MSVSSSPATALFATTGSSRQRSPVSTDFANRGVVRAARLVGAPFRIRAAIPEQFMPSLESAEAADFAAIGIREGETVSID